MYACVVTSVQRNRLVIHEINTVNQPRNPQCIKIYYNCYHRGGRGESFGDGIQGLKKLGVREMTYKIIFVACAVSHTDRRGGTYIRSSGAIWIFIFFWALPLLLRTFFSSFPPLSSSSLLFFVASYFFYLIVLTYFRHVTVFLFLLIFLVVPPSRLSPSITLSPFLWLLLFLSFLALTFSFHLGGSQSGSNTGDLNNNINAGLNSGNDADKEPELSDSEKNDILEMRNSPQVTDVSYYNLFSLILFLIHLHYFIP